MSLDSLTRSDLTYNPKQAHPFALSKRAACSENEDILPTKDRPLIILTLHAAHTNDDDDDVPPEVAGGEELDAAIALVRRRAVRADDDDNDLSPGRDGDGQLDAAIALIRRRAVRADDDDDDLSPGRDGDGQLDAAIALIRMRVARTGDDDDDMRPKTSHEDQLDAAIALVRKRTARVDDDDDDVCPTSGSADQLDAALAFIRRRAAHTNDDDDDVSPTGDDDGQLAYLTLRANPASRRVSTIPEDVDDVAPTCDGDGELVSPSVLAKRAARVEDDDDDISPIAIGHGEIMAAPLRRGRGVKSGSVTPDLDDSMGAQYAENERRLRQAQAKLKEAEERLEKSKLALMLCEADERSMGVLLCESTVTNRRKDPQASSPAAEALRAERLMSARQHLVTEQARRQMASFVAKTRLDAATSHLCEANLEIVAATQAEKEAADASAQAWAQVHLARVRKSTERQRSEAVARAAQQRKEEEARLAQARARMEEASAHLQYVSIELKLCKTDERMLDRLIAKGTTESERMESERTSSAMSDGDCELISPRASRVSRLLPSVRPGSGSKSDSVAADLDGEISFCADDTEGDIESFGRDGAKEGSKRTAATKEMRSERLARAQERLSAERARRKIALAKTETQRDTAAAKARLEAAATRLVEAEAEAAAAAQEEKEAADASASAWSKVHMERVRSSPRSTAASRAEEEVHAARERAQEEERLKLARAKLKGAQKRLRHTEKELALCKIEELALEAEMKAFRALDGNEPASSSHQCSPSVSSEEVVVNIGSSRGEIDSDSSDKPDPEVDPVLCLEREASHLRAKEAKEAKRKERLQRARARLGADHARRQKAQAETNARVEAKARDRASELGWSPVALRSPTEIVSGLGPVQRENSPITRTSTPGLTTSSRSTVSPLHPLPIVRRDGDVWSLEEAQSAPSNKTVSSSPLALMAQRSTLKPRSTLPRMGSIGGSRRRAAVVPSVVSCTHEPSNQSSLSLSEPSNQRADSSGQTKITPASALAAQRWLATALDQASSLRTSEGEIDEADTKNME
jgi:hypothetical protein